MLGTPCCTSTRRWEERCTAIQVHSSFSGHMLTSPKHQTNSTSSANPAPNSQLVQRPRAFTEHYVLSSPQALGGLLPSAHCRRCPGGTELKSLLQWDVSSEQGLEGAPQWIPSAAVFHWPGPQGPALGSSTELLGDLEQVTFPPVLCHVYLGCERTGQGLSLAPCVYST